MIEHAQTHEGRSGLFGSRRMRPSFSIIGLGGAVWLLAGYVLSGTGADHVTLGGFFPLDDPNPAPTPMVFSIGAAFLAIVLSYANDVEGDWSKEAFIVGVLVCGNCFVAAALRERLTQSWGCQYILITLALTAGLLAAKLTGGFVRTAPMVVVLATCQSVLALLTVSHSGFYSGDLQRATGTFHDPQDIGRILVFCLPSCFCMALAKHRSRVWCATWWVCSVLMLAALLFTWDRGAVIALAVGLSYVVWYTIRNRRIAIAIIAIFSLMPIVTWVTRSSGQSNERSALRSNMGHYRLAREGLVVALDHPLGVGADHIYLPVYRIKGQVIEYTIDPKNLYVYWLDILGLPGALLLVLLVLSGRVVINVAPLPPRTALTGTWICALVAGACDTPFGTVETLPSTALAGVMIGCMLMLPSNSVLLERIENER